MGHGAWGKELIGKFRLFSNRHGDKPDESWQEINESAHGLTEGAKKKV